MIEMKKYILLAICFFMCAVCLSGCLERSGRIKDYSEEDMIGLTSAEIIEKFGEFDRKNGKPDPDGLYRHCGCGYLVAPAKVGFLGTTPPEYFMIVFDDDGVAIRCYYLQVV